jgi:hypothetical protein
VKVSKGFVAVDDKRQSLHAEKGLVDFFNRKFGLQVSLTIKLRRFNEGLTAIVLGRDQDAVSWDDVTVADFNYVTNLDLVRPGHLSFTTAQTRYKLYRSGVYFLI